MNTQAPEAPAIAAAGIVSIVTRMASPAFSRGLDVEIAVNFEHHFEKVNFALVFTEEGQYGGDAQPFLASLQEMSETIADRLATARAQVRLTGTEAAVSLDGMATNPAWPVLTITTGPYTPDEDDDEDDSDD